VVPPDTGTSVGSPVHRKTNPQIASELFLSQKKVESHLRNIFRKMHVASRVALARAVERADHTASTHPQ
jgi:DNA-binding CsgD family transcriptional regulator